MTDTAPAPLPAGTSITADNLAQAILQIIAALPQTLVGFGAQPSLCVNSTGGAGGPVTYIPTDPNAASS